MQKKKLQFLRNWYLVIYHERHLNSFQNSAVKRKSDNSWNKFISINHYNLIEELVVNNFCFCNQTRHNKKFMPAKTIQYRKTPGIRNGEQ